MSDRTIVIPKGLIREVRDTWELEMISMKRKETEENCPEGYYVIDSGKTVDMLGKEKMWLIYEHHAEPHLIRLPEDMVDEGDGICPARVPEEWGRPVYCKMV